MQKLHFVGFTPDLDGLILSDREGSTSGSHVVVLDDRLLQVMNDAGRIRSAAGAGQPGTDNRRAASRQGSALSPRELQDRLRAGWTVEEVAKEAGTDVAWVNRFAAPVRAEQAQVVNRARELVFDKARLGPSILPLGASVQRNLLERGLRLPDDELETLWSAFQLSDGLWVVRFAYTSRGRPQQAEWIVDLAKGRLQARDRLAGQLGHVAQGRAMPLVADETPAVAPVAPPSSGKRRRRAAATASSLAGEAPAATGVPAPVKKQSPGRKAIAANEVSVSTKAAAAKAAGAKKASATTKAAGAKAAAAKAAGAKKASATTKVAAAKAAGAKAAGAKKAGATTKAEKAERANAAPAKRLTFATKVPATKKAAGAGELSRSRRAVAKEAPPMTSPAKRIAPTPQMAPATTKASPVTRAAPAKRGSSAKKAPPPEKAPPAPSASTTEASDLPDPAASVAEPSPPIAEPSAPPAAEPPSSPPHRDAVSDPPDRVFALPGPARVSDADDGEDEASAAPDTSSSSVPAPRGEDRIFRRASGPSSPHGAAPRREAPPDGDDGVADSELLHGPLPAPAPIAVPDHVRDAVAEPIGEPPAPPPGARRSPRARSARRPEGASPSAPARGEPEELARPDPPRSSASAVFRPDLTRAAEAPPPAPPVDPDDAATVVEGLAALYPPSVAGADGEPKRRRRRLRRG